MAASRFKLIFPSWQNAALALLSAGLLTLAFPDFEYWFLAWFALVPLLWAVEREGGLLRSFLLGWLFGTTFFFGTCWWLTYAPIHYAGFPWPLAYALILIACLGAGTFPGVFAAILSVLLRRFGSWAFLAAPFVWVFSEFARYWLTGNNWNAIAYSQAFDPLVSVLPLAAFGGIYICSFAVFLVSAFVAAWLIEPNKPILLITGTALILVLAYSWVCAVIASTLDANYTANLVAVQPNVPMSGLTPEQSEILRDRQMRLAKEGIELARTPHTELPGAILTMSGRPTIVVLPESPMNFMYNDDREFQQFTRKFTTENDVSLIFNSAEPDATNGKYFNSAVMISDEGRKAAEYDKVYLLPFGEAVPVPFDSVMPGFVGTFSYGRNYPLLPLGDAKAGVMICFESHFGALAREYVKNGADVLIEMTNDGYLGPTPVLRQHLANAVFRAAETGRPVLRITNVGISAYVTKTGAILDSAPAYAEATRVWGVRKSYGSQTLYVRFGDWFAWLCTIVSVGLLLLSLRRAEPRAVAGVPEQTSA